MPTSVKPSRSAKASTTPDPRRQTFDALKAIFKPYAKRLNVTVDTDSVYYLESKNTTFRGKPMCFGAVRMGKAYVSFHLMPLYCFPEMKKSISPALKKRMQGKQCFNFQEPDAALFSELAALAEKGLTKFASIKNLEETLKGRTCED